MQDQQIKEALNQLLDYPQHFLMSQGGEGQEFIASLISEYSPRYNKRKVEINPNTNRSLSLLPRFFTILAGMISNTGTRESLVNDLVKVINSHGWTDDQITTVLEDAKRHYLSGQKIPFLRMHFSGSDYFNKDNTWLLYLDTYNFYEYKWAMWFVKLWMNDMDVKSQFNNVLNSVKTFALTNNADLRMYDQLEQMVLQRNPTTLKEGYIAYLQWIPVTTLPDNYLDIPVTDLYNNIKSRIPDFFNDMNSYIAAGNFLERYNVIPYSRLFEPGYVEAMFEITDPEFNAKLRAWHQNNLTALEKAGIFTANWIV